MYAGLVGEEENHEEDVGISSNRFAHEADEGTTRGHGVDSPIQPQPIETQFPDNSFPSSPKPSHAIGDHDEAGRTSST